MLAPWANACGKASVSAGCAGSVEGAAMPWGPASKLATCWSSLDSMESFEGGRETVGRHNRLGGTKGGWLQGRASLAKIWTHPWASWTCASNFSGTDPFMDLY